MRAIVKNRCLLYNIARPLSLPELAGGYPRPLFLLDNGMVSRLFYMNWQERTIGAAIVDTVESLAERAVLL